MEMVGASLDMICVHDEVRYLEKYWRTKTAEVENPSMIVVKTDKITKAVEFSKTITVYNKVN